MPRLSPFLFESSALSNYVRMYGSDPNTSLPEFVDDADMYSGSYCSIAADPFGEFVYLPMSAAGLTPTTCSASPGSSARRSSH